jgi:hypothetical protein
MIASAETDWQSQRNRINHDWLKNKFLLALGKLINVLDDRIEDDDFVRGFVANGLVAWEQEYPSVLSLINGFQDRMSPRVLFARPPLSRCAQDQMWLPVVVDAMWWNRVGVDELAKSARDCAVKADAAYGRLILLINNEQPPVEHLSAVPLRNYREEVFSFRDACSQLAKAIEKFPHRILVT